MIDKKHNYFVAEAYIYCYNKHGEHLIGGSIFIV